MPRCNLNAEGTVRFEVNTLSKFSGDILMKALADINIRMMQFGTSFMLIRDRAATCR